MDLSKYGIRVDAQGQLTSVDSEDKEMPSGGKWLARVTGMGDIQTDGETEPTPLANNILPDYSIKRKKRDYEISKGIRI